MLVTRQFEPEHNHWSTNKLETIFHTKPPTSPRMSSFDTSSLSTQPDWQGQYSYLPPGDNPFSQSYDQTGSGANSSGGNNDISSQPRTANVDSGAAEVKSEENIGGSSLDHHRDPLGLRRQPSPIAQEPSQLQAQQQDPYPQKPTETGAQEDATEPTGPPSSQAGLPPSEAPAQDIEAGGPEGNPIKDEEDEMVDDDDMGDGGEVEGTSQPQTAAERTAQRRKMKRFRLTHQQTRFLMSEFAKQPHPDAAHRERLSREIPGLSPRQVQVWFQNRRAKIKRLTADDRDRMIKMRAVPDDFDNVQALHSPYGAVHGLGTPITSPVDFGISPGFGSIGFAPSATMSNPDLLSPLSPNANDRYGAYSSHMSTPLSAGPRSSNPFARQGGSIDLQNRPQMRSLQPLQLRDTMNRSRSESLQSPLRTSMSWKGNSLDYTYPGSSGSPQHMNARHGSGGYGSESINTSSAGSLGYDSSAYSSNTVQSPPSMNNYNMQSTTLQQAPQNRSRLRAASATLPLGLDLRNQYRPVSSLDAVTQSQAATPRVATSQFNTSSTYTSSFPAAPLTAPIDLSMPRTPGIQTTQDYSMPQMSAPIAPPNDFSQAFRSMGSGGPSTRTPMRDSFGGGGPGPFGSSSHQPGGGGGGGGPSEGRVGEDPSSSVYPSDPLGSGVSAGMKRKRSFTMPQPGPTPTSAPQPYGNPASMTG